jgi:hypothetical protein
MLRRGGARGVAKAKLSCEADSENYSRRLLRRDRHLTVPKRLHGINQSGVASREVAGEKRHGNQK